MNTQLRRLQNNMIYRTIGRVVTYMNGKFFENGVELQDFPQPASTEDSNLVGDWVDELSGITYRVTLLAGAAGRE